MLEHQDRNRMTVENLATIFAPCLISMAARDANTTMLAITRLGVNCLPVFA